VRAGALYRLTVEVEQWPIRGGFTISRGSKREAVVVVATISDGTYCGRGECVPYARYGESVEGVMAAIQSCAGAIASGASRTDLATLLPAGAARNALDCALWDIEAKRCGRRACRACRAPSPWPRANRFHHLARGA
jgi:L-alanine-DL-glutamate epimerase-like enolase superfamily enzyme